MNENPYASPAEVTEKPKLSEEEENARDMRRFARGIVWILWSSVLMMVLFSSIILTINGIAPQPDDDSFGLYARLISAVACGAPVMNLIGMVLCCFCPNRLVKWGRPHVIGSIVMLGLSVVAPLAGITASIIAWQIFLLRLAHSLRSTAGIRLAWGVMAAFGVLAAAVVVYMYLDMYYFLHYHVPGDRKRYWQGDHHLLFILLPSATLAYGWIYVALLEMLRRGIRRRMEESEHVA